MTDNRGKPLEIIIREKLSFLFGAFLVTIPGGQVIGRTGPADKADWRSTQMDLADAISF
jgi:hypothetical protein